MLIIHIKQAGINLSEIIKLVCNAVCEQFKLANGYDHIYYWPDEIFDDAVIVKSRIDGKLYRLGYTITEKTVTFGEAVEVEEKFVPVEAGGQVATEGDAMQVYRVAEDAQETEQEASIAFTVGQAQKVDPKGMQWRCQVIGFGMSKTRDIWEAPIFRQSLPQWENIPCYIDHPSESEMRDLPERSVQKKCGFWSNFEVTAQGVSATLTIAPSFAWLGENLLWAQQHNQPDFAGFSIIAQTRAKQVTAPDNQPARLHTQIVRPLSVDVVTQAAADGHLQVALASNRGRDNEDNMNKELLRLLFNNPQTFAFVRQSLAADGVQGVTAQTTEDQLVNIVVADQKHVDAVGTLLKVAQAAASIFAPPAQSPVAQAQQAPAPGTAPAAAPTIDDMPVEIQRTVISQAINDSSAGEAVKQTWRARFLNPVTPVKATVAQAAIQSETELLGVYAQAGIVNNPSRAEVGTEQVDRFAIALAKSFDISFEAFNSIAGCQDQVVQQSNGRFFQAAQDEWNSIPKIVSIRDFYSQTTGDVNLRGVARGSRLARQAVWVTADFAEALANVVNKRLLMVYREESYPYDLICKIVPARDFKQRQAILMGYFADLPAVAENGPYLSPSALTDTKEAYSISKKGRLVELTLEDLANDDLAGFSTVVARLGRTAKRTLAKFVFNDLVMSNPTMATDSLAVFHTSHNNLITDTLGTTGLKNGVGALLSQTEPGSNEKMSVSVDKLQLFISPTSYVDAHAVTDFNNAGGGETNATAQAIRRMRITPHSINVFEDDNDWLLTASNADVDMVELAFFNGNEEPEFFVQDDPREGVSFSNDVILRHKIRHIYGGVVVDYRGMVKSAVVDE
ncbi:MAG TPA: hypothetical protein VF747_06645 [Blastocatellia bacterium]|jgi:hypothetical protein